MTRVEVYRDGALIAARTLPSRVAEVYATQCVSFGFRVLLVRSRSESERAR